MRSPTASAHACFHLPPIAGYLTQLLKRRNRAFMDPTRAPAFDSGRLKMKTGYFCAIAMDNHGHGGTDNFMVMFH